MISTAIRTTCLRNVRYSHSASNTAVPLPRGNIKDAESFLKAIGRDCAEVSSKFESWEQLFTTNSHTMKDSMGISTKQRKYILSWVERYRKGVEPYSISVPGTKK